MVSVRNTAFPFNVGETTVIQRLVVGSKTSTAGSVTVWARRIVRIVRGTVS